jgi:hypothetical protein
MLPWLQTHNILPEFIAIGIMIVVVTAPWTVYLAIYGPPMAVKKYQKWAKKRRGKKEDTGETKREERGRLRGRRGG